MSRLASPLSKKDPNLTLTLPWSGSFRCSLLRRVAGWSVGFGFFDLAWVVWCHGFLVLPSSKDEDTTEQEKTDPQSGEPEGSVGLVWVETFGSFVAVTHGREFQVLPHSRQGKSGWVSTVAELDPEG
jgi:hypothetical protein